MYITNVNKAPFNDINLICFINIYKSDNKRIAYAYLSNIYNYLWYLHEECKVFTIFDERILFENYKIKIISQYPI